MAENKISSNLFNSYKDRIKIAEAYRKKFFEIEAKKYIQYMRNKFPADWFGKQDHDKITVNDFQVNVRAMVPSFLFQNPTISVVPDLSSMEFGTEDPNQMDKISQEEDKKAKKLAFLANTKWRKLRAKQTFKQVIKDALVQFIGVVRTDWITQNVENPDYDTNQPESDDNLPFFTKKDDLLLERIPPKRFSIDPDCPNVTELGLAQYLTLDYYKPLYELRANKDLKGTDKITGKYQVNSKFSESLSNDNEMIKKAKITLLFNQDDRTIAIISEELDTPLAVIEWADYWDKYPVHILAFTEDMEDDEEPSFYPIPDFRLYESQVQEKNQLRTRYATFVRRFASIVGYDKGKVDPDELNTVLLAPDGGTVGFDAKGSAIDGMFRPLFSGMNFGQDKLNLMNIIEGDIERLALAPAYKKGELSQQDRTKFEFSKVSESVETQTEERKDIVRDFLVEVADDCLKHIQHNLDDTGFAPIEDELGKIVQVPYGKADIQGNFIVEIDVLNLGRKNIQNEIDGATKKYELLANQPVVNQRWNTEQLLKKVDGTIDIAKAILPEPQPPAKEPPKINVSIRAEATPDQLAVLVPELKPPMPPVVPGLPEATGEAIPGTPVPELANAPPPVGAGPNE